MTSMSIPVGPFDLIQPIARGGMAIVWRARHREQGVPVAVKVMDPIVAKNTAFVRRFREEVRAVAALDHHGVVVVLDHGVIDARAAEMREDLAVGCPWLAMEFCSGGTLKDIRRALPWSAIKTILLAMLDGLAHAHARGVIHRDLKPANVLIGTRVDSRAGLKLSDFGIAGAVEGPDDIGGGDSIMGTPRFMAPEQITGAWRDQGPWTDLYSLGCLTHWLASGQTPFKGVNIAATLVMHMHSSPPKLQRRVPLPEGLDDWVARLLAKRPAHRFQCAADAAHALKCLVDPPERLASSTVDAELQNTIDLTALSLGMDWRLAPDTSEGNEVLRDSPPAAPMPGSWKRASRVPPRLKLVGAGLSLYGLRQIPLVGREAERDRLWEELSAVGKSGRARGVVVRGPSGTGKSRLVQWLSERAHEPGAARPMRAVFSQTSAHGDSLQQMGKRAMRLTDLNDNELSDRVHKTLHPLGADEEEIKVLTAMFQVPTMVDMLDGIGGVRFTHWREFYTGTRNGLFRLSRERPLIAWFDDVQWGSTGTACAHQILATQDEAPFPILLVLTVRDEAVMPETYEFEAIEKFADREDVTEIHLEALAGNSRAELVRGLLGLEGSLAAQVEERTGGNPLFAVQLVGNWVQEGLLRIGDRGFELREGVNPRLPNDLHAVWRDHIRRVIDLFDPRVERYLEIAAILGHEVRWKDWKRASDDPEGLFGDRFPGDDAIRAALVDHLILHRLAVGTRESWSFVHGMLRESLERNAHENGRLADHHIACALMLDDVDRNAAERRGRHLLEGGRAAAAVAHLLIGVERRILSPGPRHAAVLLKVCERALGEGQVCQDDPQWGEASLLRVRIEQELGSYRDALALVDELLEKAAEHGWHDVTLSAMLLRGDVLLASRADGVAEDQYRALLELATAGKVAGIEASALVGLATVARRRGEYDRSMDRLHRAVESFQRAVDRCEGAESKRWEMGIADCWRQMGVGAAQSRDMTHALSLFDRALCHYTELDAVGGAAECRDHVSRIHLALGAHAEARAGFTRAVSQYDALGSPKQFACRMRLAQAALRDGAPAEVIWADLAPARTTLSLIDQDGRVSSSLGFQLVQASLDRDWNAFDHAFEEAAYNMPRKGIGPGVVAWTATIAGELALRAGERERGNRALHVGSTIWHMAGRAGLAEEVQNLLRGEG